MTLINNADQYKKYLAEISNLIAQDPDPNTLEGERLSLLALAVKNYESNHFFFDKPSAIESIRFRMEEQSLIQKDLIPFIGSKSKVSEILSGKRNLTVDMIEALHEHLKIPLNVLIQNHKRKKIDFTNIDYKKFPINEMLKRKWISPQKSADNYEKAILDFLKLFGDFSLSNDALWRRTLHTRDTDNANPYSLIAWLTRAAFLAEKISACSYDKKLITLNFLKDLAKLSQYNQGPLLAKEKLEKNGIKLIFLKHLSTTKIDGACFLDSTGHPVIAMSLRYDRIDNFWYTLLHEMGHVYKHLDSEKRFVDNLDADKKEDPEEKEADKIACEAFISESAWKKILSTTQREVSLNKLANQFSIHPAIIAGRIRYETKNYKKFHNLIGQYHIKKILKNFLME